MHKIISAKIEQFDRAAARITVRFEASWGKADPVFQAVLNSGLVPIHKEPVYLLPTAPYDDSAATTEILTEIGDAACSSPAPEAILAMGHGAAKRLPKGSGKNSPIARLLWEGGALSQTYVRTDAAADKLAAFAKNANRYELNDSQVRAVRTCVQRQLSIIWGPPGTGKTDTLVALLHAIVREGAPKKILITGPNYRTVEELSGRLLYNLQIDAVAVADYFWLYSKSRVPKDVSSSSTTVMATAVTFEPGTPEFQTLVSSMANTTKTTIVSTTAHMVHRLTEAVGDNQCYVDEVFDVLVLDESSQIPVTLSLKPLGSMKSSAQVIVAGDHKQMPPIQTLDPPKGAEYLVDSIQNYLIKRFNIEQQPLLVNYRSNSDFVDYAKSLGYPPDLRAATPKKDLRLIAVVADVVAKLPPDLPKTIAYTELLEPARRVTALIHDDPTSSQANELEAGLVAGLAYIVRHTMAADLDIGDAGDVSAFTDDSFFEQGIGIVTPHKAQKALVVRKLTTVFPGANPELVYGAADTVERFQGGERNLIIVSFGVGDTDIIEGEEAFLLQLERTNVAISRAKAKCIVLIPKSLAYHLPSDQKAAETSIALKSYLEEFCAHRLAVQVETPAGIKGAEVRWH